MAKKIITLPAILSYPHLDEPAAPMNGQGAAKYSVSLVFTKGTDTAPLVAALLEAAIDKFGASAVAKLKTGALKSAFRNKAEDIEQKGYPEGSAFVNARSEQRPGLVYLWPDPTTGKPALVIPGMASALYELTETDKAKIKQVFYAGAIVRASITAYGYDRPESKGITFGLNNVQLIDGTTPRLDGRKAATDEFEADATAQPALVDDVE